MKMPVHGFLYSQIGYDSGDPMRALIRSDDRDHVAESATFSVTDSDGNEVTTGPVRYWGFAWKTHWWQIDFSGVYESGEYVITVSDAGKTLYTSDPTTIGEHVVWDASFEAVALYQLEERARLARNGVGWKDCGAEWREANSHATMVIGLCTALDLGFEWIDGANTERLRAQIHRGCEYLAILQDTAARLGAPDGSVVHEIPNHMVIIPGDSAQAAVAFGYAARLIADIESDRSAEYVSRAEAAMEYLLLRAEPHSGDNFSASNHGAPAGYVVPPEFMTRDIAMMIWACLELYAAGQTTYKGHAVRLARELIARQITEAEKEGEFYGHFRTFPGSPFTEKANCHHHVGHDTGTTFPHYIVPLLEMRRRWPDHPDAQTWTETIRRFAYGYFLPACSLNPFYLLPMGYFTGQGILSFCGPWHGINTSYGFGAALAVALEGATGDRTFREIAVGNLQWIAGLNAGITAESFGGCVKWKENVPPGVALPYSQVYGVGTRYTGNWTGIRGTIPNGFDVNPQFQLVVEPTVENDEPKLFTDEDWIPHGAGFIAGLATLRKHKFFADS
ncbi:MAG: hypothetical protein EA426_19320 [Spirochaetaceae bacterium]|nr:MAG: hypothetical protein EA426_19320 [Spirochaetaceae bacterium]